MSFLKRISATVSANIDRAISQIENHDAVVGVALDEVRDATARLKVQLARAEAHIGQLESRAAHFASEATTWEERAKRIAGKDEDRALDCLARRNDSRERAEGVARMLTKQRDLKRELEGKLRHLRNRLDEISHRREALRGRELSSKGACVDTGPDRHLGIDVERAFERWELDLTRAELGDDALSEAHGFVADVTVEEFEQEERDAALRAELEVLLEQRGTDR